MLEVENINARHGLLTAVHDASFKVGKGEVLGVIGANGAGKTTLFRSIAGVHGNCSGSVRLSGHDISALPAAKRVRAGLALVPEGRRLFGDMTVRENLQVAGENGRKGDWTLASVLDAFPALKPIIDMAAGNLSGGQRQTVAIARALMTNPDAILMDEVSLGLSPIAVDGLYDSLNALKKNAAMAIIVVEQDLARAMSFSDRLICVLEGNIVLEGASAELSREAVTAAYFGLNTDLESAHDA